MKKVVVILPAYNAAKTLRATLRDIPRHSVHDILLVDDASKDGTVALAEELGLRTIVHQRNRGYGGNQKTCYAEALRLGADIVVMVHPDHQYDPTFIPQLVAPLHRGACDAVFGSRILRDRAREGGMPWWKYLSNIALTWLENLVLRAKLTEYHSGFRAYSRRYLESVNLEANSDNFVFDTQIIAQGVVAGMRFREIPIRTRYFDDASQIRFWPAVHYGLGILKTLAYYVLFRLHLYTHPMFRRPSLLP